jgi:hypothetical protein
MPATAVSSQRPTGHWSNGMLDWINTWKRSAMGWVGIVGLIASMVIEPVDVNLRFMGITMSLAMICMAMPSRVWAGFRTWWEE